MSRLDQAKNAALGLATNLRGWKSRRKILVFESDDWGAIRMRDKATHTSLVRAGIPVDQWRYDSLDCLETASDLSALIESLDSHRDRTGRAPRFTMNMVLANPDFEAIRKNAFEQFFSRSFNESYQHYHGQDLTSVWEEGVAKGLLKPQFHAREHLNSYLWLRDLRAGHEQTRIAFDHDYYGLITQTSAPRQKNYLAAYWPADEQHLLFIKDTLADGLRMFANQFGFNSSTFVACNYVWPTEMEPTLRNLGICHLQGQRGQLCPVESKAWTAKRIGHFTGQRNHLGHTYGVRNVLFEPFMSPEDAWCEKALVQIRQAFKCRVPAIVSTHRVNYVSGLTTKVRDKTLVELDRLLAQVRKLWPDVEFLSSDELASELRA